MVIMRKMHTAPIKKVMSQSQSMRRRAAPHRREHQKWCSLVQSPLRCEGLERLGWIQFTQRWTLFGVCESGNIHIQQVLRGRCSQPQNPCLWCWKYKSSHNPRPLQDKVRPRQLRVVCSSWKRKSRWNSEGSKMMLGRLLSFWDGNSFKESPAA